MKKLPPQKGRPEAEIQAAIVAMLRQKGWFVNETHGSLYQAGFPDIFASHKSYGMRWIEVKLPGMKGSKFTRAQLEMFPQMVASGAPIWILTGATREEYMKLFNPCNWYQYLGIMK